MADDDRSFEEILRARGRLRRDGLLAAFANLQIGFGDMFSFPSLFARFGDHLPDLKHYLDAHPDHPMATPQNEIRIDAADYIASHASEILEDDDEARLQALHAAIFDRAAAVRLQITNTLGVLGRSESVSPLRKLIQMEDESTWVRDAAAKSLRRCEENRTETASAAEAARRTTPNLVDGRRFSSDGVYIVDRMTGHRHFARVVLDVDGGEFDDNLYTADERALVIRDLGGTAAAAGVLAAAFASQGKPYDAKSTIGELIRRGFTRQGNRR